MAKKIFISFDYENDRHYRYLLSALNQNSRFELIFDDYSAQEINSSTISVVKAGLTRKIRQADYTLVVIGKEANAYHRDRDLIGYRNWIDFEIAQSKLANNKLIAVKISSAFESPEQILGSSAKWAMSFTVDAITKAIDEA